ncbi:g6124 [Coccomyxa elongata]
MRSLPTISALAVLVAAVIVSLVYNVPEFADFRGPTYLGWKETAEFKSIGHGLYKIEIFWHMTPFHSENLDLYLINEGKAWYLTDAGGFDSWLDAHAGRIVKAVQDVIPPGQELKYIILTHGHLDHVGAIEPLIAAYPDLLVIFHETEAPFLLGDSQPSCYNYMPSGLSLPFKLLQFLKLLPPMVQYKMPPNRSLILEGPEGDLAKFGVHDLTFTHAPGHCRGHVVYHHKPSGYLLAGDFTDILPSEDGGYRLKTMCATTCNITEAHETVCRVIHRMDYKLLLPYHDARKSGWTKEELIPMAQQYSNCSDRL